MNKSKKPIEIEGKKLPEANEIEQIVLGTIILEGSCMDRLIKDFSSNLFYTPKHKIIANAITDLYKESKPIDLITIVKKLQENSLVSDVGGVAYISQLTNGISSSANIEFHLRILQEEALRRNVILISNKAIQKSFDPTEDIFEVFNDVQHRLDSSLKNVINYEIRSVGQIHSQVISESLQILKSGKKSGVPTGLRLVDNVTNGWQKTDLIIVAGRPGAGKSTLSVSLALFPSVELNIPVAIFSLEMSAEQIVSRMQSYYSEINVSKIVKKQLTEDDIVQIERKTEKFKKAPIYIDDTPNISLLELKGKVRKLVKENNVQLVIVDYLQLMRSGIKTQSRELEISEISRGLKSLAKEANIPIMALSQLSRAVESTSDKKPMLSHLRESGCLSGDTLIQCQHTKEVIRIEDLIYRKDISILATDFKKNKIMEAKKCWYSGTKQLYKITLSNGMSIRATQNHKFLTEYGWMPLGDLIESDHKLAIPINYNNSQTEEIDDNVIALIGHFLANGSAIERLPIRYTCNILDEDLSEIVMENARLATNNKVAPYFKDTIKEKSKSRTVYFKPTFHLTHGKTSPVGDIFKKYGLWNKRAKQKSIPNELMFLTHRQTAILLKAMFSGDGTASYSESNGKRTLSIFYSSGSKDLIEGTQMLLAKLGIVAFFNKITNQKNQTWYNLYVTGKESKRLFVQHIGFYNKRKNDAMLKGWDKIKNNLAGWQKVSFNEERTLCFVPIKSIEKDVIEKVYDIEVPELHNFMANGMIVHNSIEQDADMVIFCHRPEYYGIQEYEVGGQVFDSKGLFMLLLSKHRNGELGEIPLRFIHEQTKIVNYSDNNTTFVQPSENNWSNMDLKPNTEFSVDIKKEWNISQDQTPF